MGVITLPSCGALSRVVITQPSGGAYIRVVITQPSGGALVRVVLTQPSCWAIKLVMMPQAIARSASNRGCFNGGGILAFFGGIMLMLGW